MSLVSAPAAKTQGKARSDAPPRHKPEAPEETVDTSGLPRFLESVQTKLRVGAPDDPLEREADAVAQAVVADEPVSARLFRGGRGESAAVQRLTPAQARPAAPATLSDRGALAPPAGDHGAPLAQPVRSRIESATGAGLSDVRVHSNEDSHAMARSLEARAFTHGRDIWLGKEERADDLGLIAHEVAHVVQQSRAPGAPQPIRRKTDPAPAAPGTNQPFGYSEDEMTARLSSTPPQGAAVDAKDAKAAPQTQAKAAEVEGGKGGDAAKAAAEPAARPDDGSDPNRADKAPKNSGRGTGGAGGAPSAPADAGPPSASAQFEGLVGEQVKAYLEGNVSPEKLAALDPTTAQLLEGAAALGEQQVVEPETSFLGEISGASALGKALGGTPKGYEKEETWVKVVARVRDIASSLGGVVGMLGLVATVSGLILSLLIPPVGAFLLTVGKFCDVAALVLDAVSLVLSIILTKYQLYRLHQATDPKEKERLLGMVRQEAMNTVMSGIAVATAVIPGGAKKLAGTKAGQAVGKGLSRMGAGIAKGAGAVGRSGLAKAVTRSFVGRGAAFVGRGAAWAGRGVAGVGGRVAGVGRRVGDRAQKFMVRLRGTGPIHWANRVTGKMETSAENYFRKLAAGNTRTGRFYNRNLRGFHQRNVMTARSLNDPIERAYQIKFGKQMTDHLEVLKKQGITDPTILHAKMREEFGDRMGHAQVGLPKVKVKSAKAQAAAEAKALAKAEAKAAKAKAKAEAKAARAQERADARAAKAEAKAQAKADAKAARAQARADARAAKAEAAAQAKAAKAEATAQAKAAKAQAAAEAKAAKAQAAADAKAAKAKAAAQAKAEAKAARTKAAADAKAAKAEAAAQAKAAKAKDAADAKAAAEASADPAAKPKKPRAKKVKEAAPAKVDETGKVEEPATVQEPSAEPVKAKTKGKKAAKAAEPAKVEEAGKVDEPGKVEEAAAAPEPVKAKGKGKKAKGAKAAEPAKVEEPGKVDEPGKVEEPAKAAEPVAEPAAPPEPVKAAEPVKPADAPAAAPEPPKPPEPVTSSPEPVAPTTAPTAPATAAAPTAPAPAAKVPEAKFIRSDKKALLEARRQEFTELQLLREAHPEATAAELAKLAQANPHIRGTWSAKEMDRFLEKYPKDKIRNPAGKLVEGEVQKTPHHTIPAHMAPQIHRDPRFWQIVNDDSSKAYRAALQEIHPDAQFMPRIKGFKVPGARPGTMRGAKNLSEVMESVAKSGNLNVPDPKFFTTPAFPAEMRAQGSTGYWINPRDRTQRYFANPHYWIGHDTKWGGPTANPIFDMDTRLGLRGEPLRQVGMPAARVGLRKGRDAFTESGSTKTADSQSAAVEPVLPETSTAERVAALEEPQSDGAGTVPLLVGPTVPSAPSAPEPAGAAPEARGDDALPETWSDDTVPEAEADNAPPEGQTTDAALEAESADALEAAETGGDTALPMFLRTDAGPQPQRSGSSPRFLSLIRSAMVRPAVRFGGAAAPKPAAPAGDATDSTGAAPQAAEASEPSAPPTPVPYSVATITQLRDSRAEIGAAMTTVRAFIQAARDSAAGNRQASAAAQDLGQKNTARQTTVATERADVAAQNGKLDQADGAQQGMAAENKRGTSESKTAQSEGDGVRSNGANVDVKPVPEKPEKKSWLRRAWNATAGAAWDRLVAPAVRAVKRKVAQVMQSINGFIMKMINQVLGLDEIEAGLKTGGADITGKRTALAQTDGGLQSEDERAAAEAARNQETAQQGEANAQEAMSIEQQAQEMYEALAAHHDALAQQEAAGVTYVAGFGGRYAAYFEWQQKLMKTAEGSPAPQSAPPSEPAPEAESKLTYAHVAPILSHIDDVDRGESSALGQVERMAAGSAEAVAPDMAKEEATSSSAAVGTFTAESAERGARLAKLRGDALDCVGQDSEHGFASLETISEALLSIADATEASRQAALAQIAEPHVAAGAPSDA